MRPSNYIFLLIILFQVSCKKDQNQPLPSIVEESKEEYVLTDIAYTIIPGSNNEEITEQRPALEYINRTKLQQKILVDPGQVFERSTFKADSQINYIIDDQKQLFRVPLTIQDGLISLGPKKWTYAYQETKLPTQLEFKDSVYVESNKKLTTNLSLSYKKMRALYRAQLREKSSGKIINVDGVWTGVYPLRKNFVYNVQDI